MMHKFALCKKSDGRCIERSVELPKETPDEDKEWLPIDEKTKPDYDKNTEALDVVTKVIDRKLTFTYTKRAMTDKELLEVVKK